MKREILILFCTLFVVVSCGGGGGDNTGEEGENSENPSTSANSDATLDDIIAGGVTVDNLSDSLAGTWTVEGFSITTPSLYIDTISEVTFSSDGTMETYEARPLYYVYENKFPRGNSVGGYCTTTTVIGYDDGDTYSAQIANPKEYGDSSGSSSAPDNNGEECAEIVTDESFNDQKTLNCLVSANVTYVVEDHPKPMNPVLRFTLAGDTVGMCCSTKAGGCAEVAFEAKVAPYQTVLRAFKVLGAQQNAIALEAASGDFYVLMKRKPITLSRNVLIY